MLGCFYSQSRLLAGSNDCSQNARDVRVRRGGDLGCDIWGGPQAAAEAQLKETQDKLKVTVCIRIGPSVPSVKTRMLPLSRFVRAPVNIEDPGEC
eukprot:4487690-Pyramimonas_sp.AAC.1